MIVKLPASGTLVVLSKAPDAKLMLVCIPHVGAGAAVFRPWGTIFGPEIAVIAVRLPGRESRMFEEPYRSVEAAVKEIELALDQVPSRRVALFGHCGGAVVAYALAQRLSNTANNGLVRLFVSAQVAPRQCDGPRSLLYRSSDESLLHYLAQLRGTPDKVLQDRGLMSMFLPTLRADLEMIETYVVDDHPPHLTCPITAFLARDDSRLSVGDVEGWQRMTAGRTTVLTVEGNRFSMLDAAGHLVASVLEEDTADLGHGVSAGRDLSTCSAQECLTSVADELQD